MSFSILLSPPDAGVLEQEYVLRAMQSGWIAPAGPDLEAFEHDVAERVGVTHAVGLSSGTSALHLALVSWGVRPGDVVITSTMTFAATTNAIRYVGAEPFFVDSDPVSGNMDPDLLERALKRLEAEGRHIAAIVPVDLLGKCVDYTRITDIANQHSVRLLCDAAESFGSRHGARRAGSFGDASILSFNGNKVMTTSGGGMLLTDDGDLAAHVRKLATQAREPVPHYEHTEIGFNYRLSNILAALGRAQLSRLDAMIGQRREWRRRYRELFAEAPGVHILGGDDDSDDNCWLTAVVVDPSTSSWTAHDLGSALDDAGVETRPLWKPMHLQPVHLACHGLITGASEWLFENGRTLPSGSAMSQEQFDYVTDVVEQKVLA